LKKQFTIVIADNHAAYGEALKTLLSSQPDAETRCPECRWSDRDGIPYSI